MNTVNDMAIQPDGKVLIAGNWLTSRGKTVYSDFAVVRYNANGSLDTTFGTSQTGLVTTNVNPLSGYNREVANAVLVQPDGKIILAGRIVKGEASDDYDFALVRYHANGTLDTTFGSSGIVTTSFLPGAGIDQLYDATLQTIANGDGSTSVKIVAVGQAYYDNSVTPSSRFAVVRYNLDGSLDPTFGSGGKVFTQFSDGGGVARAVVIQPDGKIVAGGYAHGPEGMFDFALARYDTSGNLDPTFGTGGLVTSNRPGADFGRALVLQPDGKIVVAGDLGGSYVTSEDTAVARFHPDGSLDTSFGDAGFSIQPFSTGWDYARSVTLQSDGKIVTAGSASSPDGFVPFTVARFLNDSPPATFAVALTGVGSASPNSSTSTFALLGPVIASGHPTTRDMLSWDLAGPLSLTGKRRSRSTSRLVLATATEPVSTP